jgi:hypothetical protein
MGKTQEDGLYVHKPWKTRNTRNIVEYQQLKAQHYPQQRATVPATFGEKIPQPAPLGAASL